MSPQSNDHPDPPDVERANAAKAELRTLYPAASVLVDVGTSPAHLNVEVTPDTLDEWDEWKARVSAGLDVTPSLRICATARGTYRGVPVSLVGRGVPRLLADAAAEERRLRDDTWAASWVPTHPQQVVALRHALIDALSAPADGDEGQDDDERRLRGDAWAAGGDDVPLPDLSDEEAGITPLWRQAIDEAVQSAWAVVDAEAGREKPKVRAVYAHRLDAMSRVERRFSGGEPSFDWRPVKGSGQQHGWYAPTELVLIAGGMETDSGWLVHPVRARRGDLDTPGGAS